jgi:integrase
LWITFYYQSKRYKKSLDLDDTKVNRKLAQNKLIPKIQYKLNTGEFFENTIEKIPTVDEFVYKSFEIHRENRKTSTHNDYYNGYHNHLKDVFGHKKLDTIKPSDIELWQNSLLQKGLSARRIKTLRTVLTVMYSDAIKDDILKYSPLTMVRTPKAKRVEIKPFSLEEIKLILDNSSGQIQNFLATAFFTGMRSGELIGLMWQDIDFRKDEISVKRAIKMGEISTPKTENSVRTIDMLDFLKPYLKAQYQLTGKNNSFVFLNSNNEHIYDIKRIRNTHWKKLLKKCELEYRPIYHTRHTFATVMIENNEDILWVSNMLGHTDSTMTLSKYAKYIKRDNKKRAQFLY